MPDWTASMQRTYEYYIVDPKTWGDIRQLRNVTTSSTSWDESSDTLGSMSIDMDENVGEAYIRTYMITIQNGVKEKHPISTMLVQTPSTSFDGKVGSTSMDAYTPLLELKEKQPDIGYYIPKGTNIMDIAYMLVRENMRAPVVKVTCDKKLFSDFVAETDENWLTLIRDLISNANYELKLDEMGRVLFAPKQDTASLQPVWTFNDDNSSILLPSVTINQDLYGIPNVVEVIFSNGSDYDGGETYYAKVANNDPNSPTSIINRGREILYRVTDPTIIGDPTNNRINEYAEQLLKELSTVEYTISYSHGYCPVRVGDCVRLNYTRAGLINVKAKVINQNISCDPGCQVTETAVYTSKLCRKVIPYADLIK